MDIIRLSWKYPRSVDIICIFWIYPHFVDIIRTDHIPSYLDRNVHRGLHSFVLVVDIIYIGHIMSYLARNVRPNFHIYSFSESYWCTLHGPVTYNPVWTRHHYMYIYG